MDSFERQLVQFVVLWAPFGGPPDEEVLPSFGLSPALLAQRFNQIVSSLAQARTSLNEDDAQLLAAARRAQPALRGAQDGNGHDGHRICRPTLRDANSVHVQSVVGAKGKLPKRLPHDQRPFRQQ